MQMMATTLAGQPVGKAIVGGPDGITHGIEEPRLRRPGGTDFTDRETCRPRVRGPDSVQDWSTHPKDSHANILLLRARL